MAQAPLKKVGAMEGGSGDVELSVLILQGKQAVVMWQETLSCANQRESKIEKHQLSDLHGEKLPIISRVLCSLFKIRNSTTDWLIPRQST